MKKFFLLIAIPVLLSACAAPAETSTPPRPPANSATLQPTRTAVPSATRTVTPSATPQPSPTPGIFETATVFASDPYVPILVYHRFIWDDWPKDTVLKRHFGTFRQHLQTLYDAGYSLVPLADWLHGNLSGVPEGRRPLILSIDDLFFKDQILIGDDGQPVDDSAIGILWDFSAEHPDFGFSAALFANFGDKYYPTDPPDWEKLSQAIVWGLDHQVITYNHLYLHPDLSQVTSAGDVRYYETKNDKFLRYYLSLTGNQDMAAQIDNIIALPYSNWPASTAGVQAILSYVNPEGKPLLAVMEADPLQYAKFMPPVYSDKFNPWHVPRINAENGTIDMLVEQKEQIPAAQGCAVGPLDADKVNDPAHLAEVIQSVHGQAGCTDGIYAIGGWTFQVSLDSGGGVVQVYP